MDKKIIIGTIVFIVIIAGYFLFFQTPPTVEDDVTVVFEEFDEFWSDREMVIGEDLFLSSDKFSNMSKSELVKLKTDVLNFKSSQDDSVVKETLDLQFEMITYVILANEFTELSNKRKEVVEANLAANVPDSAYCTLLPTFKAIAEKARKLAVVGPSLMQNLISFSEKYSGLNYKFSLSDEAANLKYPDERFILEIESDILALEDDFCRE
ncbi:MAG: hypothetical protein V1672_03100 [Candidatus Diapherotrites archaeon]